MNKAWHGIIPPMVTPLKGRDELDREGLEKLIEHLIRGRVHGIFILGSTGEAPGLSKDLQRELVSRSADLIAGRVPLLVGITDTSFVESVHLAKHAADAGADALVLAPPYYFPADQPELVEYIRHIVVELPLPLFLYNMPACTKLSFAPKTVMELAGTPGIVGLKDSSGSMVYFRRLQSLLKTVRPDFVLLVGPEELLGEAVLLGGHGGVCGGANRPELYVDLYDAARSSHYARVEELHDKVMWISNNLYQVGRHPSAFLKSVKCALSLRGICDDFVAEPFHRFKGPERERVREKLEILARMSHRKFPAVRDSHAKVGRFNGIATRSVSTQHHRDCTSSVNPDNSLTHLVTKSGETSGLGVI